MPLSKVGSKKWGTGLNNAPSQLFPKALQRHEQGGGHCHGPWEKMWSTLFKFSALIQRTYNFCVCAATWARWKSLPWTLRDAVKYIVLNQCTFSTNHMPVQRHEQSGGLCHGPWEGRGLPWGCRGGGEQRGRGPKRDSSMRKNRKRKHKRKTYFLWKEFKGRSRRCRASIKHRAGIIIWSIFFFSFPIHLSFSPVPLKPVWL